MGLFSLFPAQRIVADCRPHIDLDGKPYAGEHDPNGHLLQSLHAHCAAQDAVPYRGFDRKRHLPVFPPCQKGMYDGKFRRVSPFALYHGSRVEFRPNPLASPPHELLFGRPSDCLRRLPHRAVQRLAPHKFQKPAGNGGEGRGTHHGTMSRHDRVYR